MTTEKAKDYTPYSDEWRKEMMKAPKVFLIELVAVNGRERDELKQENQRLRGYEKKWKDLDNKISKFYPEEIGEEPTGDLTDIGEVAAMAFGYL